MQSFFALGFVLLTAFDAAAQVSFKLAADAALPFSADGPWVLRVLSHPWVYAAICGYLAAFAVWMTLLRRVPIGPAFAASHLDIVVVLGLSAWLFNEPLTVPKVLGALAIVGGVIGIGHAESRRHALDGT